MIDFWLHISNTLCTNFLLNFLQLNLNSILFKLNSIFNYIYARYHSNGTFISTQKNKIIILLSLVVCNSMEPKFWNLMKLIFTNLWNFGIGFELLFDFHVFYFSNVPWFKTFYIHNLWMQHVHLNVFTLAHQCS